MHRVLDYLNPIQQLGTKKYSVLFPALATILFCVASEFFALNIAKNPDIVGLYIIFLSVAFVIYFSFRDGIRGGYSTTTFLLLYYLYIIFTRQNEDTYSASILTTGVIGLLYFFLSFTIGWLKEKIDTLIESEANEKRRLQTIIRQLPVGILVVDKRGVIVEKNKQLESLLGTAIPLGEKIDAKSETDIIKATENPGSFKTSALPIAQAVFKGKTTLGEELLVHHKNKKKTYIQVSASPIHNRKGKIIAAASIVTDITQQKEIEQIKDEFISIASHELKTPITAIKGYTQILERVIIETKHKDANKYIQKMNSYIDKLSSLVSDLLDVSKIHAGKLEFNSDVYDLNTVVQDTVESFQAFTTTHSIIKKGRIKKKLLGDASRTEQVLINLLNNAIKYSPNGKKIVVTLENTDTAAVVKVTDFGVGIPHNKQKNLFKRFYRVEETSQQFTGLGIGLYISAEIIARQDGKMWIESEEGKGTTFFFSLPFKKS